MCVSYAIVFVSDMKRSIAFYRDMIGLPLKFEASGSTSIRMVWRCRSASSGETNVW